MSKKREPSVCFLGEPTARQSAYCLNSPLAFRNKYFLDFNTCITFLVWQEAFQNGQGQLSKNAIVHVWKGEDWQNVTHKVIQINFLKPKTSAFLGTV